MNPQEIIGTITCPSPKDIAPILSELSAKIVYLFENIQFNIYTTINRIKYTNKQGNPV